MLRQSWVDLKDSQGAAPITPSIARVLQLKEKAPGSTRTSDVPPSFNNGASEDPTGEFSRLQADLSLQREDINRIDMAGYQIVSNFDGAIARIEREASKLRDEMLELRRQLDTHAARISGCDDDVAAAKAEAKALTDTSRSVAVKVEEHASVFRAEIDSLTRDHRTILAMAASRDEDIVELRNDIALLKRHIMTQNRELTAVKTSASKATEALTTKLEQFQAALTNARRQEDARHAQLQQEDKTLRSEMDKLTKNHRDITSLRNGYVKDAAGLQDNVQALRQRLDRIQQELAQGSSSNVTRELDILATNITKVGNRASQVETLEMQVELLKSRLQKLEGREPSPASSASPKRAQPEPKDHGRKRVAPVESSEIGDEPATSKRGTRSQFSPSSEDDDDPNSIPLSSPIQGKATEKRPPVRARRVAKGKPKR